MNNINVMCDQCNKPYDKTLAYSVYDKSFCSMTCLKLYKDQNVKEKSSIIDLRRIPYMQSGASY
jgi:hypothetical protein